MAVIASADNLNLYGFATYATSDKSARQNFRLPVAIWQRNPALLQIFPDGFTPTIDTEETDFSVVGGAKGLVGGWDWDGSVAYNRDYFDIYTRNTANYSLTYPGSKTDFYDGRLELFAVGRQSGLPSRLRARGASQRRCS